MESIEILRKRQEKEEKESKKSHQNISFYAIEHSMFFDVRRGHSAIVIRGDFVVKRSSGNCSGVGKLFIVLAYARRIIPLVNPER